MFCPTCGQQQISQDTRFCSRCGFLLTGVSQVIVNNGMLPLVELPKTVKKDTPRKKGIKQGAFIFLTSFLIIPLLAIFTAAIGVRPFAVALAAIALTVGGLLRIAYAFLFESNETNNIVYDYTQKQIFSEEPQEKMLPPQTSIPVSDYAAPKTEIWRETNDLTPTSVTEETTRHLKQQ